MRGARWLMLLAPVVLTGCSAVPGWSTETPDTTSTAPGVPGSNSWIVVSTGSPTPTATPRRTVSPSATPATGFLSPGTAAPRPTPAPSCTDADSRIGKINGLDVVPGPGTAVVRWMHAGSTAFVEYRVTAVSQDVVTGNQRDIGWKTATPTGPCTLMTVTMTGLDRRTSYTFSLDAVFARSSGDGNRASTVARAVAVSTT
jgi:hypothetical protein